MTIPFFIHANAFSCPFLLEMLKFWNDVSSPPVWIHCKGCATPFACRPSIVPILYHILSLLFVDLDVFLCCVWIGDFTRFFSMQFVSCLSFLWLFELFFVLCVFSVVAIFMSISVYGPGKRKIYPTVPWTACAPIISCHGPLAVPRWLQEHIKHHTLL